MILAFILLIVALLYAAWMDVLHRRIPNMAIVAVVLLWLTQPAAIGFDATLSALGVAVFVLVAGIAIWSAGCIGAGDVKLLAALTLWAGARHLPALLLITAATGGALAVGFLLARWIAAQRQPEEAAAAITVAPDGLSLPYGVAIAVGGHWLTYHQLFP